MEEYIKIHPTLLETIVDKQFEIIGESFRFKDIPEDGEIVVGKKKMQWYENYKFQDEEQYLQWRKFLEKSLNGNLKWIDYIDLRYGMMYRYKKKGYFFKLALFLLLTQYYLKLW